ncbi:hypothetical protein OG921_16095 [Aldersonia sp. NBC_00410]|uniref:hypothetical protein n=1 Tax=Aldersonia sp. NBC_00410 TaxID=2975954 RepID=UPI002252211C|nr:hypothetical protein [Aldersonia sp. NBC_00410]MCX5044688.1 hypothetical protein [Aldersonia sp. NBC_00410]
MKVWIDSLRLGMGRVPNGSVPTLAVPFYGWLFREGSHYLSPDGEPEVFVSAEEAFVADALEEDLRGLSESELAELDESTATLGPPAVLPPALLRGVAAVDRRWGGGKGLLRVGVLREVYAYLHRTGAGDVIRQAVLQEVEGETRVLVGHSLGSVVVYDLVRRGQVPQVTTLVTLGSPLGLGTVRRALDVSFAGSDTGATSWFNVYDEWDVVTGGSGLMPAAQEDFPVDNGRSDPHALTRYLRHAETAAAILSGVRGSAS